MKRVLSALFCVCAICGLFTLNLSARQTVSEQNAPAKISEKSGDIPALSGRVVDQAGVLSPAAKRELETALAAHENNTTNQLVIVTTQSLGGKAIEEYSLELGRRWGIGQKGKDNGALLVVAPNDKQVRIEVGYGLEGVLTDALCGIIINRYVIPEFKKGDIEGGVKIGAQKILAVLEGDESVKRQLDKEDETPVEAYGIIAGMALLFASGILGAALVRIGVCAVLSGFTSAVVAGAFSIEDFALRGVVMFALFMLFFYLTKNIKPGSGANSGGSGYSGGYGGGSGGGRSSGGGFSGGGGGYGGGGASGRG